jgi:hypothetical protein
MDGACSLTSYDLSVRARKLGTHPQSNSDFQPFLGSASDAHAQPMRFSKHARKDISIRPTKSGNGSNTLHDFDSSFSILHLNKHSFNNDSRVPRVENVSSFNRDFFSTIKHT